MFAALLTTVLYAISALAGRRLHHFFSGTQANFSRLIIAATLLGAWSHRFGFGLHGPAFPLLFLSGCVGFGLGDLSMLQTYPHLGARRTMVMIQCLAVPLATLIEWVWLRHAPTPEQAGFAVIILTGVGAYRCRSGAAPAMPRRAACARRSRRSPPSSRCSSDRLGGTALGQGGGAVLSRKAYAVAAAAGQTFHGAGDGVNAAYQRMTGGIFITLLMWLYLKATRRPEESRSPNWSGGWPWLATSALAGSTIGVSCFQWALMTKGPGVVLPIVATSPLLLIPLTWWLDGERITKRAVTGGLIAVAGVIGLTLSK